MGLGLMLNGLLMGLGKGVGSERTGKGIWNVFVYGMGPIFDSSRSYV